MAEAQFLDPSEWVKAKAKKGRILDKETWVYEHYTPDLAVLPYDDYTNVVQRSVGGFMWTSADEHLFVPASLMLCCSAHALRTFHLLWQNTLTEDWGGLTVNLHYNVENSLGEVISYEPYAGRTTVIPRKSSTLRVRVPEYAVGSNVKATCGGKPVPVELKGRYASFGQVSAGEEYTVEFRPSSPGHGGETARVREQGRLEAGGGEALPGQVEGKHSHRDQPRVEGRKADLQARASGHRQGEAGERFPLRLSKGYSLVKNAGDMIGNGRSPLIEFIVFAYRVGKQKLKIALDRDFRYVTMISNNRC